MYNCVILNASKMGTIRLLWVKCDKMNYTSRDQIIFWNVHLVFLFCFSWHAHQSFLFFFFNRTTKHNLILSDLSQMPSSFSFQAQHVHIRPFSNICLLSKFNCKELNCYVNPSRHTSPASKKDLLQLQQMHNDCRCTCFSLSPQQ